MHTYLAALARAHSLLEQRIESSIVETGLTASEMLVMQIALTRAESTTATILAATGLRPSTLSSLLSRLERRGYIRRSAGGRAHRYRRITLTLPGDRAVRIATEIQIEIENALGGPSRRLPELSVLQELGREISLLAPTPTDATGLPIVTA